MTVATPRGRWLRDQALPAAAAIPALRRRFTHRTAQLSYSYRDGPLAAVTQHNSRATHVPGDRLPSVPGLRRDDTAVVTLDLIDGTAHTLLILTGNPGSPELVENLIARFERWRSVVQPVVVDGPGTSGARHAVSDPELRAHHRYHALNGRLLLMRPDGHLAASAPLQRPDIPEQYLQHITATNHGPSPRAQAIRPLPSRLLHASGREGLGSPILARPGRPASSNYVRLGLRCKRREQTAISACPVTRYVTLVNDENEVNNVNNVSSPVRAHALGE